MKDDFHHHQNISDSISYNNFKMIKSTLLKCAEERRKPFKTMQLWGEEDEEEGCFTQKSIRFYKIFLLPYGNKKVFSQFQQLTGKPQV